MRKIKTYVLLVMLASFASPVLACSPIFLRWWENKSARPAPDCSFDGGGRHDWTSGEAAQDLGGGRVMQIINDLHNPQQALVSDCNVGEQIAISNPDGQETTCGFWSYISPHLAPEGELDLSYGDNLQALASYVEARGYSADQFTWVSGIAGVRLRRRDIPDFSCGCKIFYPDSIGASQ